MNEEEIEKDCRAIYQIPLILFSKLSLQHAVFHDWHLKNKKRYNNGEQKDDAPEREKKWVKWRTRRNDTDGDVEKVWKGPRKPNINEAKEERRDKEIIKALDGNASVRSPVAILLLGNAIYARINQKLLEHGEHLNFRHFKHREREREGEMKKIEANVELEERASPKLEKPEGKRCANVHLHDR